MNDNFFDLGGDSLRAASLIADVEKKYDKKIRLIDFFAAPTVERLAVLLRERGCSSRWTSLFSIQPRGCKPPFFWVHGDGSNFLLLYDFMHQSQDGTLARYTSVEEIAAHYLEELLSVQPEGPYFPGGYSFGGLIAFEMAQQLQRRGDSIVAVFVGADEPRRCAENCSRAAAQKRTPIQYRSRTTPPFQCF